MTQINRLKMQGDELERNMGTNKKDYRHLIEVYKQGLKFVEGMLKTSYDLIYLLIYINGSKSSQQSQ